MTALTRRRFLTQCGAAALTAPLFERGLPAVATIHLGYAAITWGGNDEQAIEDISSLGFRGIQLRSNVVPRFTDRPDALRDLLASHRLTLVALSSGNLSIDPAVEQEQLELHTRHATFLKRVGGLYLQIIDERPRGREATPADFKRLGLLLTELGKRTADLGVPISYHHHMGSLGERPEEIRAIVEASDPRYVKFQLDTAHYYQGGGDPAQAIREYADRLLFLHIKDVESPVPGEPARAYRFVELGRGRVDFTRVFAALREVNFNGWAVVELDSVPDPSRSPRESAIICKTYLQDVQRLSL